MRNTLQKIVLVTAVSYLLTACGGGASSDAGSALSNQSDDANEASTSDSTEIESTSSENSSSSNSIIDMANRLKELDSQQTQPQTFDVGGVEFPDIDASNEITPTEIKWANDGTGSTAQIVNDLQLLFRAAQISEVDFSHRVDNQLYDDARYLVDYKALNKTWPTIANRNTNYADGSAPKDELLIRTANNVVASPTVSDLTNDGSVVESDSKNYQKLACANGRAYSVSQWLVDGKPRSKDSKFEECLVTDGKSTMTVNGSFRFNHAALNTFSNREFRSGTANFDIKFSNADGLQNIYKGKLSERSSLNINIDTTTPVYEYTRSGDIEVAYKGDATDASERYFKLTAMRWDDNRKSLPGGGIGIVNEIGFKFSTNDPKFNGEVSTVKAFQIKDGTSVIDYGVMKIETPTVIYRISADGTDLLKLEIDAGKDGTYEKSDYISPYSIGIGKQGGNFLSPAGHKTLTK